MLQCILILALTIFHIDANELASKINGKKSEKFIPINLISQ